MRKGLIIIRLIAVTLLLIANAGCETDDFKVVDNLQKGMSKKEVRSVIESYSFKIESTLIRPIGGWKESDETFTNLPGRARWVENELGIIIESADYYPVSHGILGFGQLLLFYNNSEKLVYFYRRQIN